MCSTQCRDNTVVILAEFSSADAICQACLPFGFRPVLAYFSPRSVAQYKEFSAEQFECVVLERQEPEGFLHELAEHDIFPVGIINCLEHFVVLAQRVQQLINTRKPSCGDPQLFRDKFLMKSRWHERGIETTELIASGSANALSQRSDFHFPVIVKPSSGAASAGVRRITKLEELRGALSDIAKFNYSTQNTSEKIPAQIIVEGYAPGDEYAVDQFWHGGKPFLTLMLSKSPPEAGQYLDRLYYVDVNMAAAVRALLSRATTRAVQVLGIEYGVTHTEVRFDKSTGSLAVIETALRPGASAGLYPTYEKGYGVDVFKALVLASLNLGPRQYFAETASLPKARRQAFWYNVGYQGAGRIKRQHVTDACLTHGFIDEVVLRKRTGDYLPREGTTLGYLAWVRGSINPGWSPTRVCRVCDQCVEVEFE